MGSVTQSGAYCQDLLSVEARTDDRAAIIGDEAHIVSAAPNGPRSTVSIKVGFDSYENLMLLCRTHHKMVDDQSNEFTVERLLEMKKCHENDTEAQFSTKGQGTPLPLIRIKNDSSSREASFTWLQKGSDVWDVIAEAQSWKFMPLDEDNSSEKQQDAADEFLTLAQNYGDISFDLALSGLSAIRAAKRQFGEQLDALHQLNLVVFGRRVRRIVTGGVLPDDYWMHSELLVMRLDDVMKMTGEDNSQHIEV